MVEEPSLPRELSPAFTTSLVTHPEGWAGLAAGAVLEGSESPAGERQLWPSRKPRLKWKRCVGCGLTGCESLPLTGEEELGQIGQFQWPQPHTAPRAHQESGPAVSFRGLTLENRESVVRSLLKSQQLPSNGHTQDLRLQLGGKCLRLLQSPQSVIKPQSCSRQVHTF